MEHEFGTRLAGNIVARRRRTASSGALVGTLFALGQTLLGVSAGLNPRRGRRPRSVAADPERSLTGTVELLPKTRQAQIEDALRASGRALKLWLLGQLRPPMSFVGVLVCLGTVADRIAGAAGASGCSPGSTDFIRAVLYSALARRRAGGHSGVVRRRMETVLRTLLLFVVVQQLKSHLVVPLSCEQKMVEIPAALLLFAVVAVGLLFGIVELLVAAPLTVVTSSGRELLPPYARRLGRGAGRGGVGRSDSSGAVSSARQLAPVTPRTIAAPSASARTSLRRPRAAGTSCRNRGRDEALGRDVGSPAAQPLGDGLGGLDRGIVEVEYAERGRFLARQVLRARRDRDAAAPPRSRSVGRPNRRAAAGRRIRTACRAPSRRSRSTDARSVGPGMPSSARLIASMPQRAAFSGAVRTQGSSSCTTSTPVAFSARSSSLTATA